MLLSDESLWSILYAFLSSIAIILIILLIIYFIEKFKKNKVVPEETIDIL